MLLGTFDEAVLSITSGTSDTMKQSVMRLRINRISKNLVITCRNYQGLP